MKRGAVDLLETETERANGWRNTCERLEVECAVKSQKLIEVEATTREVRKELAATCRDYNELRDEFDASQAAESLRLSHM